MHHALYVEYLCVTDCDKQAVLLQEGETIGYKWVDRDTLFTMGTRKLISDRTMELVRELNI